MKLTALKKTMVGLLFALLFVLASPALARTSGSHYHATRSSRSVAGKTVHVRSYTKKNGTHVDAYNRRPPHSKP